ncbi:MAG: spermidine/putrescine ABC transporter substrate-binding protein [Bifidobacteriaceae bacterium]|jgi:spermidine/putrescine transport system substrate-binding protein|nr:spermidine/putrescine ABC transporter substrate-binding protein [Bifidobacteriaceae bacterium]
MKPNHQPVNRRRPARAFASAAAVLCLAAGLAACGGGLSGTPEPKGGDSAGTGEFTPATSGRVTIYTWADYFPTEMLTRFTEETGVEATIDFFASNEELLTKLEATGGTGYDVVVPSDYAVEMMIERGLALKIDVMGLPNAANIADSALHPYYDPEREYSAPFMYGTTGFAYNAALLAEGQEPPQSWHDFFTWEAPFAGKIGMLNDEFDGVNAALRAVGAEPCTTDPDDLQAALDLLLDFKARVNTISSDAVPDRLGTGQNSMAMIWNGDTHRAWVIDNAITYVYAAEGLSVFEDNWVVPSGAENVDQAKTFINWMLDPKNAAEAGDYVGFNAQIDGVFEYLDPEMRSDPAVVPPDDAILELVQACDNETMNKYSQIWESFRQ